MKKQSKKQIAFTVKKGAEQTRLSQEELKAVLGGNDRDPVHCW